MGRHVVPCHNIRLAIRFLQSVVRPVCMCIRTVLIRSPLSLASTILPSTSRSLSWLGRNSRKRLVHTVNAEIKSFAGSFVYFLPPLAISKLRCIGATPKVGREYSMKSGSTLIILSYREDGLWLPVMGRDIPTNENDAGQMKDTYSAHNLFYSYPCFVGD